MKGLVGIAVIIGVLALGAGGAASRVGAARRIATFEREARALATSVDTGEPAPVRERVGALAAKHDVVIDAERMKVRILELDLEHFERMLPDERLEAHRRLRARERCWYVELGVAGRARWLLGTADFEFEHHVPAGPLGR
ncbi:MAG: hypothetical protein HY906_10175 [Deltaproteobacteria bacterium]|nr:hypothetical protein [Deltaproteobacteria bacterium]